MSKDNLYVEAIGGSLDNGRERQIANIYDHRGNSVCDQVWLEDAEEIARRWNAHNELVAALRTIALTTPGNVNPMARGWVQEHVSIARAALAKAGAQP